MSLFDEPDPWNSESTDRNGYSSEWITHEKKPTELPGLATSIHQVSLSELRDHHQGFPSLSTEVLEQSVWGSSTMNKHNQDSEVRPFGDIANQRFKLVK